MAAPLFSVTRADFEWQYFRGRGKGGQKRNKTSNACRCTHRASGAVGVATDTRSQGQNRRLAFERCVATEAFQRWLRLEIARRTGQRALAEAAVDKAMRNVRVEVFKDGRWTEEN